MEDDLKQYLCNLSNAVLGIADSPKSYIEALSKAVEATIYSSSSNSEE